jgi:mannose-1-phosphate guanylyltransferase
LWPLSRALLPKQFLPLASNSEHRFPAAEQLRDIGEDDIVRFVDDYKRA